MLNGNVWCKPGLKKAACLVVGLTAFGLADNPISSYHYLADPSAASDGDTFYILTDTDDMCVSSDPFNYDIVGLYAFSSKDMKNWTDHGMIFRSKREFGDYPSNTWASGIAVKNGKVYIVYPDGASGVGMITAPSIDGPYTDPIAESYSGKNKIAASVWGASKSVLNGCDDIDHCFDPGIFIDDDGSGYVIFGGGSKTSQKRPIGNNFDIVKFNDNNGKITIDVNSLTRIQAPNSFEAPYLHKKGDYYYLSFNNSSQVIDYSMSKTVTGPYEYVGEVIPAIWKVPGANNLGGNNHQGFAEFKGKWYAVYHDRRLVSATEHPVSCSASEGCVADPEPGNHRSVSIDELTWNGNKMNTLVFTNEGPAQVGHFDPYQKYKALTSSKQRNVRSRTDWTKGQAVKHVLTPFASKESWIRVSGVDFGSKSATRFEVTAASVADGNKVEIRSGSASGTLAGTCTLKNTGDWNKYETNECDVAGLSGVVDELFLVFKGAKDSTMGLLTWEFFQGEPEPQTPFKGVIDIPGKVEMENFDVPGVGKGNDSYYDNDTENHGDSDYRDGTGVDLYKKATGVVVGYNQEGEWLEYTVNVKESGDYTLFAAVASANATSSFKLSMDDVDITENISVPQNDGEENWDDYTKVSANVKLEAGEHILRFTVTGDWMDIDYINFAAGANAADPDEGGTTGIAQGGKLDVSAVSNFDVFDLSGKKVASFTARSMSEAARLWQDGSVNGAERFNGVNLIRDRSNGMIVKVRVTR